MPSFTILEPISTGDVIDRAVRLYRRNFIPLVAITAVPALIGYIVSVIFWAGYSGLITSGSRGVSATSLWMLALGGLGYPIWAYVLLVTVSGLSRIVGDHLMLSAPITFRGCFGAAKRRLGAITLMGFLSIAMLIGAYIILSIVMVVVFLLVALIVGVIAAARLPQWVATIALAVTVIVAVGLALLVICAVAARVVFLPQIVMIEGQSAGNALGRAIRLGKGNWHRVGAIALFTYFVSASLLAALTLPVLAALYLWGVLSSEFLLSPTWNILYTSFGQISNLLSLPIWIVSFTLLYFDSRVRREAYDLDLIAREINPGFIWEPVISQPAFGYQSAPQLDQARPYVQTGPLGLAGYRPVQNPTETDSLESPEGVAPSEASEGTERTFAAEERAAATCKACGAQLLPNGSFCMNCGSVTP